MFSSVKDKLRVLVIHRPQYDDWSFPKGKHDEGESDEAAALREIYEETGVAGRIIRLLGNVEYRTSNDNQKRVTYFAVRAINVPVFEPNSEVDRMEWLSRKKAMDILTYQYDRDLLADNSLEQLNAIGQIHLVRHAAAGDRTEWSGDDTERPITSKGLAQSVALADDLESRWASRILSSPYLRCVQTAEPLAERLGRSVNTEKFLGEGSGGHGLLEYVARHPTEEIVMVSHGDVIPAIVDRLDRLGVPLTSRHPNGSLDCKKSSIWVLTTENGEVTSAEYVPPPDVD